MKSYRFIKFRKKRGFGKFRGAKTKWCFLDGDEEIFLKKVK